MHLTTSVFTGLAATLLAATSAVALPRASAPGPRHPLQFPLFDLFNATALAEAAAAASSLSTTSSPPSKFTLSSWMFDGSVTSCGGPDDVFQPQKIALTPDPPRRGKPLTVEVIGETTEDVTEGAYADVVAKLGVIKLVDRRLDLCEEIKQINRECPVEKGHQEIVHTVDIPKEVPPGKYTISVDAFTASGAPLTCLRIQFRI
ncbi:Phosphatidylglycerol/phosphatidylinositol transfer protein [Phlyctochytrium bullatum]|nr:Phosphatidylglycerol/phosphatidylinositol transfer protein [Phlyctochytrium bullatum]